MKPIEELEFYLADKTAEQKLQIWNAFRLLVERDELLSDKLDLENQLKSLSVDLEIVENKIEALK